MGMLEGKVAIITGSGRGIGAAAAKMFAAEGAAVVVSDLDAEPAEQTAAAIRSAGGRAIVVPGDVTDPAFAGKLLKACVDEFGMFDIIVNNAGYAWDAVIQKMTDKQWYAMLEVHATAPFRILREAAHYIRDAAKKEQETSGRAKPRKVINVTSVAGVHGNPGQASYSTAKAGITGLTKTLAKEWGRYNVQVNCVGFGFIDTRMTAPKDTAERLQRDGEEVVLGIPAQMREMAALMIPLGRPGTPEEAASAMLFLASPLSNYISGHVLEVTGGGDL